MVAFLDPLEGPGAGEPQAEPNSLPGLPSQRKGLGYRGLFRGYIGVI